MCAKIKTGLQERCAFVPMGIGLDVADAVPPTEDIAWLLRDARVVTRAVHTLPARAVVLA